jgi:hypothetical protein
VARIVSPVTRSGVRPCSTLTSAATSSVHRLVGLPNARGRWCSTARSDSAGAGGKAGWIVCGRERRRSRQALEAGQSMCLEGVKHRMHVALGAPHPLGEHRHRFAVGTAQHDLAAPQQERVRTAAARFQRRALVRRQRPNVSVRFHPQPYHPLRRTSSEVTLGVEMN